MCIRDRLRRHLSDTVGNSLCYAACHTVASARSGRTVVEAGVVLQIGKFDVVRLENTHQLFKGDDEIDIAADAVSYTHLDVYKRQGLHRRVGNHR